VILTITTTGKLTLVIVASAFIAWAVITAIWIPKRNAEFPATLTVFMLVSALFFVAQMGAVYWVTSTQEVEAESAAGETTPEEPTPAETTPAAGDATAGEKVFASAGCGGCHTLAAAGSSGAVGPNLDALHPSARLVADTVTTGKGVMPSFAGSLSHADVTAVAAYVSSAAGE